MRGAPSFCPKAAQGSRASRRRRSLRPRGERRGDSPARLHYNRRGRQAACPGPGNRTSLEAGEVPGQRGRGRHLRQPAPPLSPTAVPQPRFGSRGGDAGRRRRRRPASDPAPHRPAPTCPGPRHRLRGRLRGSSPLLRGGARSPRFLRDSHSSGFRPAPAGPAAGHAPARPSPVLIGSCSHPSRLAPPPAPSGGLQEGKRPRSGPCTTAKLGQDFGARRALWPQP